MSTLIKNALAISNTLADTIYASISWSGGSRVANAVIYGEDTEIPLQMARLARKCNTARIKPTTDGVIELLMTPPELAVLTDSTRQAMIEAGESESSIDASLKSDHEAALARHAVQSKLVAQHETEIRELLDGAFEGASNVKFPTLPADILGPLEQRVIAKVKGRKPRIIVEMSQNMGDVAELKAVNQFLEAQAA